MSKYRYLSINELSQIDILATIAQTHFNLHQWSMSYYSLIFIFLQVLCTVIYPQEITTLFKGRVSFFLFVPPYAYFNDELLLALLAETLSKLIKSASLPGNSPITVDTHGDMCGNVILGAPGSPVSAEGKDPAGIIKVLLRT